MGNGLSDRVPQFQRDYSWGTDEWDDLWQDMVGLFGEDPEPAHYMGYSVLQSPDNRAFDILDARRSPIWQQRTIARWERPASQKSVLFIKKANSPSLAN